MGARARHIYSGSILWDGDVVGGDELGAVRDGLTQIVRMLQVEDALTQRGPRASPTFRPTASEPLNLRPQSRTQLLLYGR